MKMDKSRPWLFMKNIFFGENYFPFVINDTLYTFFPILQSMFKVIIIPSPINNICEMGKYN